jgi:hypothetical protein
LAVNVTVERRTGSTDPFGAVYITRPETGMAVGGSWAELVGIEQTATTAPSSGATASLTRDGMANCIGTRLLSERSVH